MWEELTVDAGFAVGCWMFFFFSCGFVEDSWVNQVLLYLMFFLFVALIWTGPPLWRARRSELVLDEGGVRLRVSALRMYVPYDLLLGGDLSWAFGRRTFRLLDRNHRPLVGIPVLGPVLRRASVVGEELGRRASAGLHREDLPPRLRRRGQPLRSWASALQQEGKSGSETRYRSDTPELALARGEVANPTVHPEDRAVMAALLLASGDPADEALVRRTLGPSSPPLLVGMIHLLRPDLVPTSLLRAIQPFLDDP